jgi:hypothetical protein
MFFQTLIAFSCSRNSKVYHSGLKGLSFSSICSQLSPVPTSVFGVLHRALYSSVPQVLCFLKVFVHLQSLRCLLLASPISSLFHLYNLVNSINSKSSNIEAACPNPYPTSQSPCSRRPTQCSQNFILAKYGLFLNYSSKFRIHIKQWATF